MCESLHVAVKMFINYSFFYIYNSNAASAADDDDDDDDDGLFVDNTTTIVVSSVVGVIAFIAFILVFQFVRYENCFPR